MLLYFAYGSNMSWVRMTARVPVSGRGTKAMLPRHALRFHKVGQDGSGKCDACKTGRSEDRVLGVVYELEPSAKAVLDRIEGVGKGYVSTRLGVILENGREVQAHVYVATLLDPGLLPFSWYRAHVLRGARELCLPEPYIKAIEAVACVEDPDEERNHRESAIPATGCEPVLPGGRSTDLDAR